MKGVIELNNKEKELQILKAYYDKRYNNTKIDVVSFDLKDGPHEGAYYLSNLKRDGYLMFEGDVLHTGGRRHEKYNNNVVAIWWSDAHITKAGEEYLKENKLI